MGTDLRHDRGKAGETHAARHLERLGYTVLAQRHRTRFGEIDHDNGVVRSFNEKPQASAGIINGGFFFLEHSFLDYLTTDPDCILERAALEQCVEDKQLHVYEHAGFWQCMDTYRDWERLDQYMKEGNPPWLGDRKSLPSHSPLRAEKGRS